jgi:hypothetical protein
MAWFVHNRFAVLDSHQSRIRFGDRSEKSEGLSRECITQGQS